MIVKLIVALLVTVPALSSCAQTPSTPKKSSPQQTNSMDTSKLTNATVKAAIDALQSGSKKEWFDLFTADAELYDDGNKMNFHSFFDKALGHERFVSIDKVENDGKDIYGRFHSDQWGDFKTFFKFHINADGKITRLDIGQANY